MNRHEVAQLLALAVANHPERHNTDLQPTATLWLECLGHLPFDLAKAALIMVLSTSPYWPKLSDIQSAAQDFQPSELPSGEEAWAEVLRKVQKVGYTGDPHWSHPVIGKVVSTAWGSWTLACQTMQVNTVGVDRKQFLDMYHNITRREREGALLPPGVRQVAAGLTRKLEPPDQVTKEKGLGLNEEEPEP